MRLGTFDVEHEITCKCRESVRAGGVRRLYAKFFIHCWLRHSVSTRELAAGLWALAQGKRP